MLGVLVVATTAPFVLSWMTAFRTDESVVLDGPFRLPETWHWENLRTVWTYGRFGRYFLNTVLIVLPGLAASILLSILAAYPFARMTFPGRDALFVILMTGMMVPLEVLIISLYQFMNRLSLLNTYLAVIFPQVGMSVPFGVLVLRAYMRSLPAEITDAAVVDGANSWQVLWRVLVPMSRPAIAAAAIFIFIWNWNDFVFPLVLTTDPKVMPLTVGLVEFQGQYRVNVPELMAGATIVTAPLLLMYGILQRYFVDAMALGATR
jgi:ABC-type glycerol-3-phosphate transport system permease component